LAEDEEKSDDSADYNGNLGIAMTENAVAVAAENFIKAVKSLGAYGAYSDSLTALKGDSALRARIDEFKKANRERIMKAAAGHEPDENEDKSAAHMYWQLALDETAAAFLESERELSALLRESFVRVIKEIGLETDFYI
jgi:cell fate (sporulation/competence/biofilm development) regulator YlbF (YheA/YmcA/DUF963 family)